MNTDVELRIWHNGLNVIYPPILILACENAVLRERPLEIGEGLRPLEIGDFETVVLGAFRDYIYHWTELWG